MSILVRELKLLFLLGFVDCLLVPALFWWLGSHGILTLPGMEIDTIQAAYLHFAHHLNQPLVQFALVFPYLLFVALRMLIGTREREAATELGLAVSRGESNSVQHFIDQGKDLNEVNAAGEAPLHLAAMRSDMDMVCLLLEGGADCNSTDHANGYSPLQIAALQGHSEICEMLIRYGATVDTVTARQETALHLAARAGHAAVVTVLLKYRANTGLRNDAGQTARQIAQQQGHAGVVDILDRHASSEWPYLSLSNG